jgi:flavin-binding monooxygenase-like protein
VPRYVFEVPVDRFAPPLPTPDRNFGESHLTMSAELLETLGTGDDVAKPDIEGLDGDTVRFVDGSAEKVDVIIYVIGYNITCPFFDPGFLSAPRKTSLPFSKRMFVPGMDDLLFVGFGQTLSSLLPFVELQARIAAAYLAGRYRPPSAAEMTVAVTADEHKHIGHYSDRPRHIQRADYFSYERDIRKRELPAGRRRMAKLGPVKLARRVTREMVDAPGCEAFPADPRRARLRAASGLAEALANIRSCTRAAHSDVLRMRRRLPRCMKSRGTNVIGIVRPIRDR